MAQSSVQDHFAPFTVEDENLITGQNPASASDVAAKIVLHLTRKENRKCADDRILSILEPDSDVSYECNKLNPFSTKSIF